MIVRVRTPDGRVLDRDMGPVQPYVRPSRRAVPLDMGIAPQKGGLYFRAQYRDTKKAA